MVLELSPDRADAGFSLIELMIAAGLLLVIAVGLIPLFTGSMLTNVRGQEATAVSNMAKSRVEELMRLPFTAPELTVPGGDTRLETKEYYSIADESWKPGEPGPGREGSWVRTTTIRQYNVQDLADGSPQLDNPLDGNTDLTQVQLKEIRVEVESTRTGGALGVPKKITLAVCKPF